MCAEASRNLFSPSSKKDFGSWGRGEAFLTGDVDATASIGKRGIDLSASEDIEGGLSGVVRDGFAATFKAGVSEKVEIGITAAFPLDLFKGAGAIVRLKAKAEASAYVMAEIGLETKVFEDLLKGNLKKPWLDLAEIFLDEVSIEAGLWASASISLMAYAEAGCIGCLVSSPGKPAGFTFSFGYGVGFVKGVGKKFLLSFDLEDPGRMFDRLSDKIVVSIDEYLPNIISPLNESDKKEVIQAMTYLKLLLPVISRSAFELGNKLASPQMINDVKTDSKLAIVQIFVREAAQMIIQSLFDIAIKEISDVLSDNKIINSITSLEDDEQYTIMEILISINDILSQKSDSVQLSLSDWMTMTNDLLNPLIQLSELQIFGKTSDDWKNYVSLFWSSAVLLNEIGSWTSDASSDSTNNSDSNNISVEINNTSIITYILQTIGKPTTGTSLTRVDLIEFILKSANLEDLGKLNEGISPLIDFLSTPLGDDKTPIIQKILQGLGKIDSDNVSSIWPMLLSTIETIVQDEVLPKLIEKLKDPANPELTQIIKQIVEPTLRSFPSVILPHIENLTDENSSSTLREEVSVILLQFVSRLLLTSARIIQQEGMKQASGKIHDVANNVKNGALDDVFHSFAPMIHDPVFGNATKSDIADVLDLAAITIDKWTDLLPPIFNYLEELMTLGFSTNDDAKLDQVWSTISTDTTSPPLPDRLKNLTDQLVTSIIEIIKFVIPKIADLLIKIIGRAALAIIAAVKEFIKNAVDLALNIVNQLGQDIDSLKKLLEQFAKDLERIGAEIAQKVVDFSNNAIALEDTIIENIRSDGWNKIVQPFFVDNALHLIPFGFESTVENMTYGVYNGVFDEVKYLLEEPLKILRDVAEWTHTELVTMSQTGMLDIDILITNVKRRALNAYAQDLVFNVDVPGIRIPMSWPFDDITTPRINLGTFTIPSEKILNTIIDIVFSGLDFLSYVQNDLIPNVKKLLDTQTQNENSQTKLTNEQAQQDANLALGTITTNDDLEITINSPSANDSVFHGDVLLQISLKGANRSFVNTVLGVPKRVKIYLNGVEYPYTDENWTGDNPLIFTATLHSSGIGLVPFTASSVQLFNSQVIGNQLKKSAEHIIPMPVTNSPQFLGNKEQISKINISFVKNSPIIANSIKMGFSPNEMLNGYRMTKPGTLQDHPAIVLCEGRNTIQVIVLDGTDPNDTESIGVFTRLLKTTARGMDMIQIDRAQTSKDKVASTATGTFNVSAVPTPPAAEPIMSSIPHAAQSGVRKTLPSVGKLEVSTQPTVEAKISSNLDNVKFVDKSVFDTTNMPTATAISLQNIFNRKNQDSKIRTFYFQRS